MSDLKFSIGLSDKAKAKADVNNEQKVFIYTLSDPRTGEVKYVGKTVVPKRRDNDHCSCVNSDKNTYRIAWIKSLAKLGLKPQFEIIEKTTIQEWPECEKFWIQTLKFYGCKLTNLAEGGKGGGGKRTPEEMEIIKEKWKLKGRNEKISKARNSPECNAKICASMKAYYQTPEGIEKQKRAASMIDRRNPETRKKISDALNGKPKSEAHRKKIGDCHRGLTHTEEARKKMSDFWQQPEVKKWHSEIFKGRPISEETRKKMSIAGTGRKASEETLKKLSKFRKAWWSEKLQKLAALKQGVFI